MNNSRPNNVATPDAIMALIGQQTEEEIDDQDRLLQKYRSRARLNPTDRMVARGIELERVYRASGNDLNGYAEALGMQGRNDEAAHIATDPVLKAELQERANAVWKDDDACGCDTFTEADGYLLPNQYIEGYGFSAKHQKRMPFIRCTLCGDVNARTTPQHLADQHAIRNDESATDQERLSFFRI